jgi:hypothetical protein
VSISTPAAGRPARERLQNPYSRLPDWFYPGSVLLWFSLFILYGLWVGLFETTPGQYGPYLSPFNSPGPFLVNVGPLHIPPAFWIAPIPLAFRLTCYYYRKAYFRSFLRDPYSCAHTEPAGRNYKGETRFWVFNNLHRFALYLALLQVVILWYDVVTAFWFHGGLHFGLGNVLMIVNIVCLSGYSFGCHAFRHLVGGGRDCLSCSRSRYQLWKGVTVLNINHSLWAWVSMFTVWGIDLYIRLLAHGVIPHGAWN